MLKAKGAVISLRGHEWGCAIARSKGNETPESADDDQQQPGSVGWPASRYTHSSPSTLTRSRRTSSMDRLYGWRSVFEEWASTLTLVPGQYASIADYKTWSKPRPEYELNEVSASFIVWPQSSHFALNLSTFEFIHDVARL
ncbi:hypothetical protein CNMCM5793_007987 [Aspergillus hiratsukae]|uniref:Uncharacterized protein n=1 Tax=Aspergillus hiratsukae TaxID=1194566 RepID=A0A8H6UDN3_9EURO|nr:hypothetical protein CNMCM5793_007987 [Aspergillus hiratsukae]KAF7158507.1 hypothetical protein CNMCM6106_005101 [Aspergillus hiratsukae]